mgnify:CR=1 FL=1
MLLIISLIIVALFIYFLKDSLKKYANIFYIGVAVISIAVFLLEFLSMPLFVKNNILGIFAKGSLGTAMFVVVMYTGALPKGNKLIAPLMKIRGELSITAAILVLCHNFTYGMTYFRMLFTKTSLLSATQLAAAVISLVLIAIMLVLTVTSFPSVRKKMQAKKWKQLQRTAYVFYGLMYVHIMLINIPYARLGLGMYIANVVIYSIVFLGYAAMRIAKAVSVKAARAGKAYGKKPETVLYGLALVICAVMTVSCFAGRQTVSASEDNEEWNDFFNEETVAAMVKEIESSTAKTDAEGTTQESLEESVSSDGQSDSQAGGVGNEVSGNSNNSGSDNSSGNSSDSGNQSAQPDNGSDNSGELSGGSGSDTPVNTKFKADGTYTGSAVCETYNYNVTVTIVISGDTITSVTAESEAGAQDVQYFNMANAKVPAQLLANQSTSGVDSVSGATKSSNAIKKAFYYAYKSAKK